MLDIHLHAGEDFTVPLPSSYNALVVVAEGRVTAGDSAAKAGELLLFANDGERLSLAATEDTHVILLSGEPIREPIVQYGPFVMNSIAEIQKAIVDVETGRFGPIPD
jgi:redox-sensitive bicupin YhaK (pirin superfamily)